MYYLTKEVTVSASHSLKLDYDSLCKIMHGHNWKIKVYVKGRSLNGQGMLIDFKHIKEIVNELDHKCINDVDGFEKKNPTAENIAKWVFERVNKQLTLLDIVCYRVDIQETEGSGARYEEI